MNKQTDSARLESHFWPCSSVPLLGNLWVIAFWRRDVLRISSGSRQQSMQFRRLIKKEWFFPLLSEQVVWTVPPSVRLWIRNVKSSWRLSAYHSYSSSRTVSFLRLLLWYGLCTVPRLETRNARRSPYFMGVSSGLWPCMSPELHLRQEKAQLLQMKMRTQ